MDHGQIVEAGKPRHPVYRAAPPEAELVPEPDSLIPLEKTKGIAVAVSGGVDNLCALFTPA